MVVILTHATVYYCLLGHLKSVLKIVKILNES